MNKIFFISGVNGVGKSSIIPYLSSLLPIEKFEIHDFDERGVPEKADSNWRISEIKYWLEKEASLTKENKSIVVCGFVKLTDFPDYKTPEIVKILLSAQPEIIRKRLKKRYTKDGIFDESQKVIGKTINVFIDDNIYILDQMEKMFKQSNCPIVDTSELRPDKVARTVAKIILK
ncbi:MAG: hypothetical protein WCV71_03720 [Patescibacteria group bacterium]